MKGLFLSFGVLLLSSTALAQDYVGDDGCSTCHANMPYAGFFNGYKRSGHPWKVFRTAGEVPPDDAWPWTPVPPLPIAYDTQLHWDDVEYVIGNYFWKARFVDRDGYIHTGDVDDATQWNLLSEEFVPYHAGELDKPFDCGRCHTTGYSTEGHQHGLPGLTGTWAQDGVRCEACHGPASDHVDSYGAIDPPGGKDCADCHYRDEEFRMPWKGGFIRHHQQAEGLSHSAHKDALDCNTCHNPHKSTVYQDGGSIKDCSDCHAGTPENNYFEVEGMESVNCIDCHMPFMAKSGQSFGPYEGDVRGHLFQIMTEPIAAADNVYDVDGSLFWNQDNNGDGFVTLDYACLSCHAGMSLEDAAAFADGVHSPSAPCPEDITGDGTVDVLDLLAILTAWGTSGGGGEDLTGDGIVDVLDLLEVLGAWGPCP